MTVRYVGSGPYCYANSLAMVMGARAPQPSAIEVLTGSPFGATFIAGLPYFSPAGWDVERKHAMKQQTSGLAPARVESGAEFLNN